MARWVFLFCEVFDSLFYLSQSDISSGAGGEEANARVCKTCIRGFNSRPALHSHKPSLWRIHMSKADTPTRRGLSLDAYAVALALGLALLIRFNLIPPIKW
jgi:hypothetical protein